MTWSGIKHTNHNTGVLIVDDSFRLTYRVEIDNSVHNGSDLYNFALVENSVFENTDFTNTGGVKVHIPDADPTISINLPAMAIPGENFTYNISYRNTTRPSGAGVYVIHKLPDYSGSDIKLLSIVPNN